MEKIILSFFILLSILFFTIVPIENYGNNYNYIVSNDNTKIKKNSIKDYKDDKILEHNTFEEYFEHKVSSEKHFFIDL